MRLRSGTKVSQTIDEPENLFPSSQTSQMMAANLESPGPRITMAKANERMLQIGKAFKEMQTAYGLAITSTPPDPEKNLWANEKIRKLELVISQSIVFLGEGNAWTDEEEKAVDELNRYVATVGDCLESDYPLLRDEDGRTPDGALAQSPIERRSPGNLQGSQQPVEAGYATAKENEELNRTRRNLSGTLDEVTPVTSPERPAPLSINPGIRRSLTTERASTPVAAAAASAGNAAKGAASAILRMIGARSSSLFQARDAETAGETSTSTRQEQKMTQ